MRKFLFVAVLITGSCQLPGPTRATEEVLRDDSWWVFAYNQADIRKSMYFCAQNWTAESVARYRQPGVQCGRDRDMIPLDTFRMNVRLIEVASRGSDKITCTKNSGTYGPYNLNVPDNKWESGCVPHEILHIVLDMIDDPCHVQVEHKTAQDPPENPSALYRYARCNPDNR